MHSAPEPLLRAEFTFKNVLRKLMSAKKKKKAHCTHIILETRPSRNRLSKAETRKKLKPAVSFSFVAHYFIITMK